MNIVKLESIENKLIKYKDQFVIIDYDVAQLYNVKTKEINQAVSNNPSKFPCGYVIELSKEEKQEVVKKFDHLSKLKYSPHLPKVFTEKGFICETRKKEVNCFTSLELKPEILCVA